MAVCVFLIDLQCWQPFPGRSLKAYSKVVLKRVYDNVALGVRLLLVEDVSRSAAWSWHLQGCAARTSGTL